MEIEDKPFYYSKTFWMNLIAIIILLIQTNTSFVIGAEIQVLILAIINIVIRSYTKQPIHWVSKE